MIFGSFTWLLFPAWLLLPVGFVDRGSGRVGSVVSKVGAPEGYKPMVVVGRGSSQRERGNAVECGDGMAL